ncbi:hypothetical protein LT493_23135 [Streptomyces tricolor]|nr:hypothetical protein [Streptomyces tricolor]
MSTAIASADRPQLRRRRLSGYVPLRGGPRQPASPTRTGPVPDGSVRRSPVVPEDRAEAKLLAQAGRKGQAGGGRRGRWTPGCSTAAIRCPTSWNWPGCGTPDPADPSGAERRGGAAARLRDAEAGSAATAWARPRRHCWSSACRPTRGDPAGQKDRAQPARAPLLALAALPGPAARTGGGAAGCAPRFPDATSGPAAGRTPAPRTQARPRTGPGQRRGRRRRRERRTGRRLAVALKSQRTPPARRHLARRAARGNTAPHDGRPTSSDPPRKPGGPGDPPRLPRWLTLVLLLVVVAVEVSVYWVAE